MALGPVRDTQEVFQTALDQAANDDGSIGGPFTGLRRRIRTAINELEDGNFERAEHHLQQALDALEEDAGKPRPGDARQKELANRILAHAKLEQLQVAEALEFYRKGDAALEGLAPSERWDHLRNAAIQLQQYAERANQKDAAAAAVQLFQLGKSFAPDISDARNYLGMALVEFGRLSGDLLHLQAAEKEFNDALTGPGLDNAQKAKIQINLAVALWMQGERDESQELKSQKVGEAITLLHGALAMDNLSDLDVPRAKDNLGNALMVLDRTAEAIQAYESALEHLRALPDSHDNRIARARSFNNLGTAYVKERRIDEALGLYEKALELRPAESMPIARSTTQHNIADAFTEEGYSLRQTDPHAARTCLEYAVHYYDSALEIRQQNQNPLGWSVTTVNLAVALKTLAEVVGNLGGVAERTIAVGYALRAEQLCRTALTEPALPDPSRVMDLYRDSTQSSWDIFKKTAPFTNYLDSYSTIPDMGPEKTTDVFGEIRAVLVASGLPSVKWRATLTEAISQLDIPAEAPPHPPASKPIRATEHVELSAPSASNEVTKRRTANTRDASSQATTGNSSHASPVSPPAADGTDASPPAQLIRADVNSLPAKAPMFYAKRPKGQNIIDFLRDPDGWGPYVAAGLLSRPDLKRFDPKAYKAVENWLLHEPLPEDVRLPKKADLTDLAVAQHRNAAELPANVLSALRSRRTRKIKLG